MARLHARTFRAVAARTGCAQGGKGGALLRFAEKMDAKTYWDFYDDVLKIGDPAEKVRAIGGKILRLMDDADSIVFDVSGLKVDGSLRTAVKAGSEGLGPLNITNWELYQTLADPRKYMKARFFENGKELFDVGRDLLRGL